MACERAEQERAEAVSAHEAAVAALKRFEGAIFGSQSPPPILLSDSDVEALKRLEAAEEESARLAAEKARLYEEARRRHRG